MITIADLCPYWTSPPTGGGPLRVYNINRVVAARMSIRQFSARPTFGHMQTGLRAGLQPRVRAITENYVEYQYTHPFILALGYMLYRLGLHSDLFLCAVVQQLSPRFLRRVLAGASLLQVEHPWLIDLALQLAKGRPIVYVAHNVESRLWVDFSAKRWKRFPRLVHKPRELEQRALKAASAIVAMSDDDAAALAGEYHVDPQRIVVIPNGVDVNRRRPATAQERLAARARLELDDRPVLLFTGSDHFPNKEALEHIIRWQADIGERLGVQFLIVGGVGRGTSSTQHMRIAGLVTDVSDYLHAADIGLNPLLSGSGTSLKLVEYLASGLPTITTRVGMRGLDLQSGRDVLLGDLSEFPALIEALLQDEGLREQLALHARRVAKECYSWERLGTRMFDAYERALRCASA